MNLYKFTVHSLNIIKTNTKPTELTSDLNGLTDIFLTFLGQSSSSTRYLFFMNFVMMCQIIFTIEGHNM